MTDSTRDRLRSFVDRIERVNDEITEMNRDKRDIYAEAKSSGFDVKALKTVIQRRAQGSDAVAERDAIVQTYETALGTPVATRARVPAEKPKPAKAAAAPRQIGDIIRSEPDTSIPGFLKRGEPEADWLQPGGAAS